MEAPECQLTLPQVQDWSLPPTLLLKLLGNVLFFQDGLCMLARDSWQSSRFSPSSVGITGMYHAQLCCTQFYSSVFSLCVLPASGQMVGGWLCTWSTVTAACRHSSASRCGTFVSEGGQLQRDCWSYCTFTLILCFLTGCHFTLLPASEKGSLLSTGSWGVTLDLLQGFQRPGVRESWITL